MNDISGFSPITAQYSRPQVSAGQQPTAEPTDSVGSSEPGGLPKRPEFAPASATGPSEGQSRSIGWGRNLVYVVAIALTCAGATGCATVNHQTGKEPPPVAYQAGKQLRQAGKDWHEKVDKPAAQAVKDVHENVTKPIGHWFRDRAKELRDGITGK